MKGLRNESIEHSWEVHLGCGRATSSADVEEKEMKVVDSDVFGCWGVDIKKSVIQEVVVLTPGSQSQDHVLIKSRVSEKWLEFSNSH